MANPDHLNNIERKLIDTLRTGTYKTATGTTTAWTTGNVEVFGAFTERGEIYGVGYDLYIAVDADSAFTVNGTVYKGRRLFNYLMLAAANVLMDCDFSSLTETQVLERHFSGFRAVQFDPETEIYFADCSMIVTFKNTRPT